MENWFKPEQVLKIKEESDNKTKPNQNLFIPGQGKDLMDEIFFNALKRFSEPENLPPFLSKCEDLKLPTFCQTDTRKETKRFNEAKKNCNFDFTASLPPILKPASSKKNDETVGTLATINELDQMILDNAMLLEDEKCERLKTQDEMCQTMRNNNGFFDKNAAAFLKMCSADPGEENHGESPENDKNLPKKLVEPNLKNFIRRNIQLAAKAMSKLPLTDEEKQQLETIINNMDVPDDDNNIEEGNEREEVLENAFHFSEDDRKRISEIDCELNNYQDTQHLRPSNSNIGDNFWKSLILEQMLTDIDAKLASIYETDKIQNDASVTT